MSCSVPKKSHVLTFRSVAPSKSGVLPCFGFLLLLWGPLGWYLLARGCDLQLFCAINLPAPFCPWPLPVLFSCFFSTLLRPFPTACFFLFFFLCFASPVFLPLLLLGVGFFSPVLPSSFSFFLLRSDFNDSCASRVGTSGWGTKGLPSTPATTARPTNQQEPTTVKDNVQPQNFFDGGQPCFCSISESNGCIRIALATAFGFRERLWSRSNLGRTTRCI